jgi:signal transduction histidine kinase
MSTRILKWLAVILPISFWIIVLSLRTFLFSEHRTTEGDLFALLLLGVGAGLFSRWVFRIVENRELEIKRRTDQLAALHAAALALTTELDLPAVLQKVVDLARTLANARYGALGVLDEQGKHIDQFIDSGLTPEDRLNMAAPPRGHGLLGAIINDGKPIRVPNIESDPRSSGFPPNHPAMTSFLGVPIQSKRKIIGNLYLADKIPPSGIGHTSFSELDEQVLEMFATQAAIAIENAHLYRQTQQLAILKERERFGMDLHDGIIQSVYAIGLMLEDSQHRMENEPKEAKARIDRAIHDLNDVIRDIRNYIMDLRPQRFQGRDLKRGLEEMARGLRANTLLSIKLQLDAVDLSTLTSEQTVEILHIVQEALTNVRKHARANNVEIILKRDGTDLLVRIRDDGIGPGTNRNSGSAGYGLENMRERAHALHGDVRMDPAGIAGMSVTLRVPMLE